MTALMLDVSGCELTAEDKEILDHPLVGGVILFTRNFHDKKQVRELVQQMRHYARNPLLLAVGLGGGRVQRFRRGFSAIPAMGSLYPKSGENIALARDYAEHFGYLMAAEVMALDIDISFAPVLDIHGVSEVIGDRAFHQQPDMIVSLAEQFIRGMHRAGMKSTGKHFPGHGNVREDSHIAMPVDNRSAEEILSTDMAIFEQMHHRGLLDAVMPAHVIYPNVDDLPAGFSQTWVKDILRRKMQFDGVVFSDDLSMQGAVHIGSYAQRAQLALDAGCDMVLVCNDRNGAAEILDNPPQNHTNSKRLAAMFKSRDVTFESLHKESDYVNALNALERFLSA